MTTPPPYDDDELRYDDGSPILQPGRHDIDEGPQISLPVAVLALLVAAAVVAAVVLGLGR